MFRTKLTRKDQISNLKLAMDSASNGRAAIKSKLREAKLVEDQLTNLISETCNLTITLQEKLNSRLKLTNNSIKTIYKNLREGVILLDFKGNVLDVNESYEKIFQHTKDEFLGGDFSGVIAHMIATKLDGSSLEFSKEEFLKMSNKICKECKDPAIEEILTFTQEGSKRKKKLSIKISLLDNAPERIEDVIYVVFFKPLNRAED